MYLTLQEKEDSGLNEVGVGALSASPLGGTFFFWFSLAEQSLRVWLISKVSQKRNKYIIFQLVFEKVSKEFEYFSHKLSWEFLKINF